MPASPDENVMTQLVLPSDTNPHGTAFGGHIMAWIDLIGGIAAARHARATVVTASVDELHFVEPVRLGDIVILKARVNYAGRTSMEVGVRVIAENPLTGERRHTTSAYLTFVAIGKHGEKLPVPPIEPATFDEKRRFEKAERRRAERLQRRGEEQQRRERKGETQ